ncbi:hypothetical protein PLESTM_001557700 [Pleodorina starrii]|nr:hypothetical protein PLESTM_001557700 [Pleodorina starrii]
MKRFPPNGRTPAKRPNPHQEPAAPSDQDANGGPSRRGRGRGCRAGAGAAAGAAGPRPRPGPRPGPRPQSSAPPGSVSHPSQGPVKRPRVTFTAETLDMDDDNANDQGWDDEDLTLAARAVLSEAAELPLFRRQQLLAAAARLPELAPLFQTSPAHAAAAFATPPPRQHAAAAAAASANLDLPDLQKRLEKLARAVLKSPAPAAGGPAAAAAATAGAAAAADALNVYVVPEYDKYGMKEERVRAVISLKAIPEAPQRARVALTCVLDRSMSMDGTRIELVRQTIHFLIDQLTDDDWLGLVSYAGEVQEDLPLLRMSEAGRALAHRVTEALVASDGTALYDGLCAGVRQQIKAEEDLRAGCGGGEASRIVHSCFLFTDGQAMQGPTSPDEIISGLQQLQLQTPLAAAGSHNVTVNTFGFGSDHSVELLQAVAEAQGGVYYYIKNTDDIASGFGDALGGLLAVVAKSVRLEVRPSPGVTLAAFRSGGHVIGGGANIRPRGGRPPTAAAAAAAVPSGAAFHDIFAGETRECLLAVNIPPAVSELAVVNMSYTDVATGARVSRAATLRVRRAAAARPAGQLPAELMFVTAARFETLDAIEAAQREAAAAAASRGGGGGGNGVSSAQKVLDKQLSRLASSPLQVPAVTALMDQTRLARISIRVDMQVRFKWGVRSPM